MPIRVDRSSPVPLYYQVAQHLEHMIESGELPMGTRLENETDLADQLGLSRPTMRRAIEYLVGRGLLARKRGIGTQVVHAKVTRDVELTSLYDDLAKTGRAPSTRVDGARPVLARSSYRLVSSTSRVTLAWTTCVPIPRLRASSPRPTRYSIARRIVGRDRPSWSARSVSFSSRVPIGSSPD